MPTREAVFTALFNAGGAMRWETAPDSGEFHTLKETSRRIKLFSDVPADLQPWLGQQEPDDQAVQVTGQHYKQTWKVQWIIYHRAGDDPNSNPSVYTNQMVDAAFAALEPGLADPGRVENRNTLFGLVHHCYIDGRIFKDPGDIDNQALIIVPITVLVP